MRKSYYNLNLLWVFYLIWVMLIMVVLVCCYLLVVQDIVVSGMVIDEDGEMLIGVIVLVKGIVMGIIIEIDGSY